MKQTERKYWVNGYQKRGGWLRQFSASIGNRAILLSWGYNRDMVTFGIDLYKLV